MVTLGGGQRLSGKSKTELFLSAVGSIAIHSLGRYNGMVSVHLRREKWRASSLLASDDVEHGNLGGNISEITTSIVHHRRSAAAMILRSIPIIMAHMTLI